MVKRRNILITGCNGQLGVSLMKISSNFNDNFFFNSSKELDISNYLQLESYLKKNEFDTIINCAAYTNVEMAESNYTITSNVNEIGVKHLSKLCSEFNIQLIHISTDYVFDGYNRKPYKESDKKNPQNIYGITKSKGEDFMLGFNLNNSIIIRTSWLYSDLSNNFVCKILEKITKGLNFSVVVDEVGSPTYSNDLAQTILEIIPKIKCDNTEIYHYSNLGSCSRYELACMINKVVRGRSKILPIDQHNHPVKRPKYSVLDTRKIINDFGLKINNWEVSLNNFIKNKYLSSEKI